jgi:salicylate hydroxylase
MGADKGATADGARPILMIGAGIGGLAAALALLRHGIDVEIYEQAEELREVGAGVQVSPNGSRVLKALGILDDARTTACETQGKEVRLWNTGQTWKLFDLGNEAVRRFGFPYFTVYRVDLHNTLIAAVRALKPDAIRLGRRCLSVVTDDSGTTARFGDGSEVRGRALVGADGIHSSVRQSLFGDVETSYAHLMAWRGVLPMDKVPAHLRRPVATNWIGPGGHVIHYPLRSGELMNFVGYLERDGWVAESWTERGSTAECARDFAGWHGDVQALIASLDAPFKWGMVRRPPLARWSRGRATLLGDACHAMLPFLAQGAVMALEDGLVLARAIAEHEGDDVAAFFAYEQARQARTYRVVDGSAQNLGRFHNPLLADAIEGPRYVEREWAGQRVSERYDWIFDYDAATVSLGERRGASAAATALTPKST